MRHICLIFFLFLQINFCFSQETLLFYSTSIASNGSLQNEVEDVTFGIQQAIANCCANRYSIIELDAVKMSIEATIQESQIEAILAKLYKEKPLKSLEEQDFIKKSHTKNIKNLLSGELRKQSNAPDTARYRLAIKFVKIDQNPTSNYFGVIYFSQKEITNQNAIVNKITTQYIQYILKCDCPQEKTDEKTIQEMKQISKDLLENEFAFPTDKLSDDIRKVVDEIEQDEAFSQIYFSERIRFFNEKLKELQDDTTENATQQKINYAVECLYAVEKLQKLIEDTNAKTRLNLMKNNYEEALNRFCYKYKQPVRNSKIKKK